MKVCELRSSLLYLVQNKKESDKLFVINELKILIRMLTKLEVNKIISEDKKLIG